eukprot:scaffold93356_cov20-Tisochrysis_lutea.AAC.1
MAKIEATVDRWACSHGRSRVNAADVVPACVCVCVCVCPRARTHRHPNQARVPAAKAAPASAQPISCLCVRVHQLHPLLVGH